MDYDSHVYTRIEGQDLSGHTIDADGKFFTRCNLEGAEFLWRGDAPYGYADCATQGLTIRLAGRALMVVTQLAAMLGAQGLTDLAENALAAQRALPRPH